MWCLRAVKFENFWGQSSQEHLFLGLVWVLVLDPDTGLWVNDELVADDKAKVRLFNRSICGADGPDVD